MAVRRSCEGRLRLAGHMSCRLVSGHQRGRDRPLQHDNPATSNRIRMKTVDAGTGENVSRSDLMKGYAVAKNEYVLLDKEDFEKVKLESTRILDIEKFVPRESIDRLYWDMLWKGAPTYAVEHDSPAARAHG